MNSDQIEEVRLRLNLDVTIASDSPAAPAPIESFTDMCLHPSIMKDIAYHEYSRPTSIQAQAMPIALSGRDLLGCAETGSGKTAAFTIPMIQHCLAQSPIRRGDGPLALVLAPTRELAQQIEKEVKAFSRSLESLKTAIVVGGTNIEKQRSELRAGVEIVVATPGRFIDHLQQGNTSLSRISFVVLDEADRMLDMGFEPQIREIMRSLPEKHQTLLFSATMPVEIETLAKEYLSSPVQVKVGKVSSPTTNVSQTLVKVSENEKIDQLLGLLVEEASQAEKCGHPFPRTIVFIERKTRCDEVAEALVAQGLSAVPLHGGRSQSEREAALQEFRSSSTSILRTLGGSGSEQRSKMASSLQKIEADESVLLCVTHSNLKNFTTEIRFSLQMIVEAVKEKLWKKCGTAVNSMHLELYDDARNKIADLSDNSKPLGFYSPLDGFRLHIVDLDPSSVTSGGWLEDTSLVEKYKISEEAYNKREGTFRKYKEKLTSKTLSAVEAKILPPDANMEDLCANIKVGSRCEVEPGEKRGVVKFVGRAESLGPGFWIGVQYDEPLGKHDGIVKGVRYFECPPSHGGMVRPEKVKVGDYPERDLFEEDEI